MTLRRASKVLCGLLACGLGGWLSFDAKAAPPERNFVSLPLAVEQGIADHIAASVQAAIDDELARAELPMRPLAAAKPCEDASCAGRVAQEAGADLALRGTLNRSGPDYALSLEIVDAAGGVVATVSEVCDTCGRDELVAMTEDLAKKARRKLDAQSVAPPSLVLRSTPSGARVELDGELIGVTPLDVEVPPGTHALELSAPGHIGLRQRINFVDGVEERRELRLEPIPDDMHGERPGRGMRIAGWSGLGVGAAGLVTGGTLFALDGREVRSDCSGDNVDAQGNCRWRWNATPGAVAFTAVGGAALVAGAVLLGLGYGRARAREGGRVALEARVDGFALRF